MIRTRRPVVRARERKSTGVTIKNQNEIGWMRDAGFVVSLVHVAMQDAIAPGVTTLDLDTVARDVIKEHRAIASFLGHHGFKGNICASVNDEIVHGIPSNRVLRDGDIITVDVGAIINGWHGDSAWTYGVGTISPDSARLLRDTEAALYEGIRAVEAGSRLGAIGEAVERFAAPLGYGIVRGYGGHGIGREMWEDPHIPNHFDPNRGPVLRPGMTLAIEPMLNLGGAETAVLEDEWTVVTEDGSWSAHFEHTVVVTDGEPEILTKRLVAMVQ